jgi:hypothetical protein
MATRRETIGLIGMAAVSAPARIDLASMPGEAHERFMRLAITKGRENARRPVLAQPHIGDLPQ